MNKYLIQFIVVSLYLPAIPENSRRFTDDGMTNLVNLKYLFVDGSWGEHYAYTPSLIANNGLNSLPNLTHKITWFRVKNLINLTHPASFREKCATRFREKCRAEAQVHYESAAGAVDLCSKHEFLMKALNGISTLSMDFPSHRTEDDLRDYKLYREVLDESLKHMDDAILGSNERGPLL